LIGPIAVAVWERCCVFGLCLYSFLTELVTSERLRTATEPEARARFGVEHLRRALKYLNSPNRKSKFWCALNPPVKIHEPERMESQIPKEHRITAMQSRKCPCLYRFYVKRDLHLTVYLHLPHNLPYIFHATSNFQKFLPGLHHNRSQALIYKDFYDKRDVYLLLYDDFQRHAPGYLPPPTFQRTSFYFQRQSCLGYLPRHDRHFHKIPFLGNRRQK
jgi:hypothetical protein